MPDINAFLWAGELVFTKETKTRSFHWHWVCANEIKDAIPFVKEIYGNDALLIPDLSIAHKIRVRREFRNNCISEIGDVEPIYRMQLIKAKELKAIANKANLEFINANRGKKGDIGKDFGNDFTSYFLDTF